jgi:hypothetical protein
MLIFCPARSTSIVRVPGLSVDLPLAPGLYVPVRSPMPTGLPASIGSLLGLPTTPTVPLSAPPRTICMEPLSAPAGRAAGLFITDSPVLTVRS